MGLFSKKSEVTEAEKRAMNFNISLSNIGRVVFRGMGGTGPAIQPKAIFKKGFHWNYNGAAGEVKIYPKMGTVTGAVSTSKRPETGMYYAAMQKGNDTTKDAFLYAIYCTKGVDYASSYINNPLLQQGGAIKQGSKATLSGSGTNQKIKMTSVGEGNQEIIMFNVDPDEVICARSVLHTGGEVYLGGPTYENSKCKLKKWNKDLFIQVIGLFQSYGYDDRFKFADAGADKYWFTSE